MTPMKKILVIEDVDVNRDLLVQMLENEYQIVTAEDGRAGFEITRRERPDLILMDLSLPIIDGLEATRLIKADSELKHIPVIAVTACAMAEDEQRARESGCDDYLSKPVRRKALLEKVRNYLEASADG